jgi:hypothetical protein
MSFSSVDSVCSCDSEDSRVRIDTMDSITKTDSSDDGEIVYYCLALIAGTIAGAVTAFSLHSYTHLSSTAVGGLSTTAFLVFSVGGCFYLFCKKNKA